jgi:hypothetical protein
MRKYLGNYVDTYAPKFKEQLSQQNPEFVAEIKAKIADLREDPYHNTQLMKGQHKGKRKARLNSSDRLAFVICEECKHEGFIKYNRCSDCKQTPENTIVIAYLILGHDYKGKTRW